jgi:hypothetical protein
MRMRLQIIRMWRSGAILGSSDVTLCTVIAERQARRSMHAERCVAPLGAAMA